jgi:hypothetical protein
MTMVIVIHFSTRYIQPEDGESLNDKQLLIYMNRSSTKTIDSNLSSSPLSKALGGK